MEAVSLCVGLVESTFYEDKVIRLEMEFRQEGILVVRGPVIFTAIPQNRYPWSLPESHRCAVVTDKCKYVASGLLMGGCGAFYPSPSQSLQSILSLYKLRYSSFLRPIPRKSLTKWQVQLHFNHEPRTNLHTLQRGGQ